MSVCNLYKKLWENETNTFYCFTEYSDSLAGVITDDGGVKVSPSQFLLLNLKGLDTEAKQTELGKLLQNYYDNATCVLRDDTSVSRPADLHLGGLMKKLEASGFIDTVSGAKYAGGKIDIVSTQTFDGCAYTEWMCYVTPTATRQFTVDIDTTTKKTITDTNTNIRGYKNSSIDTPYGLTSDTNGAEFYKATVTNTESGVTGETSFDFNAVLVLMDITIGSVTYTNVPMGICLLKNTVTKTISDSTVYGQGTTWGLKVAMRFANTKDGTNSIIVEDSKESNFLACIDRLNTAIDTMNAMTAKFAEFYNDVRNLAWSHNA